MVFKRKETAQGQAAVVVRKAPPSIISADLRIVGDIDGDGELHVEGHIDGNIRCEALTVGESGHVVGKIMVNKLRLFGTITGSVRARMVSMMKSARMIGDVTHERIEIEAGAMVDGLYKHLKAEDFEKRGERFRDLAPPDLPKGPIPKTTRPDGIPVEAKPGAKSESPAKSFH